jgi:hypothetical protein
MASLLANVWRRSRNRKSGILGRAAGLRNVLPVRRLQALPAPASSRARVPGGLDRLFTRSRRRDLHRHSAGRYRAPEGEAVVLPQAAVFISANPDERTIAARIPTSARTSSSGPAPSPARICKNCAGWRRDDGVRTPGNPGAERRAGLQARIGGSVETSSGRRDPCSSRPVHLYSPSTPSEERQ